jgi:hypothetical protein
VFGGFGLPLFNRVGYGSLLRPFLAGGFRKSEIQVHRFKVHRFTGSEVQGSEVQSSRFGVKSVDFA